MMFNNHTKKFLEVSGIGNLEVLKNLIDKNVLDKKMYSYALVRACINNKTDIIEFLLENGADINYNRSEAFRYVLTSGNSKLVEYLIDKGANLLYGEKYFTNSIFLNMDIVFILLKKGVNCRFISNKETMDKLKLLINNIFDVNNPEELAYMVDMQKYFIEEI